MRHFFRLNIGILCLSLFSGCNDKASDQPQPPRPVNTIVLGQMQSTQIRNFPGKILPSRQADLSFEIAGRLTSLPIKKGEMVKKSNLLAQLDQKPFKDTVQQMQARYNLAKNQYQRGKHLVKDNFISRAEYDKLESAYKVSDANLNTAKRNLKDSTLYAPFNGIIADTYVENHEQIRAKQTILALHDISELDIEVHVPEKLMLQLKDNEERSEKNDIVVRFDSYPKQTYPIDFKEFSAQSDPDTQTYAVVFTMKQPNNINVLPGMSVSVIAKMSNQHINLPSYYSLPVSAVFSQSNQQSYVWIVDPATSSVKRLNVKTGMVSGDSIEVISGLKPGQRVVTAGVHQLQENQKVTLPAGKPHD